MLQIFLRGEGDNNNNKWNKSRFLFKGGWTYANRSTYIFHHKEDSSSRHRINPKEAYVQ